MAGLAALTLALLAFLLCPLTTLTLPTDNALTTSVSTSRPTATIDSGVVLGITKTENATGSRVNAFLGVPFAAEPIRWGPPESAAPWTSPFDASQYGPACVQRSSHLAAPPNSMLQWYNTPLPQESEDCLNACVYVPVSTNNTPKPVMVWLYDDGIFYGSNAMPHSDGSILAANEDVIVVVVNYRTNVFGFPGSPQIPITQNNLGYLDQRFALSWVQRNIAAFGGDPNKVTIFGEGEGARSIDALITQPPNPLTFHAAIMESGTNIFASVHASSASWVTLVAAMNCSSPTEDILGCMRAVPATTIKQFNVLNHLPWSPVIDNVTVAYTARSNRLSSTTQDSKIARVPILSGTNADEGRLLSVGADDFSTAIRGLFLGIPDAEVNRYLAQYPCNGPPGSGDYISGTFNGTLEQLGALYTDYLFQCPARLVQLDTTEAGVPSWRYYYNASFPNTNLFSDAGVYYTSEVGIVLGTYPPLNATVFQDALFRYMQHVWAEFARNPVNFNAWPRGADAIGVLGGGVRAEDGMHGSGLYLEILNASQIGVLDKRCGLYRGIYDGLAHSENKDR